MVLGRACLLRREEGLLTKEGPREGLGFPFKITALVEKLNFDLLFSSTTKSEDTFFAVFYAPNKTPKNRIGVSVAKKLINKATKRNKVKRIIKNSFMEGLVCERGVDVVVRVKYQASRTPGDKILIESLTKHWQKIMRCSTTRNRTSG
jgi:ribonuclease P protein component|tara:strand:- start:246 stop:689 length:444 start_codon:yes stop_codon:yes gene_type:complete